MSQHYTGALFFHHWEPDWPWSAIVYENGLIAGHGVGATPTDAYADAWEEFWKHPPDTLD